MDFCHQKTVLIAYHFISLKEENRNQGHLLAGLSPQAEQSPGGQHQRFQILAVLWPACSEVDCLGTLNGHQEALGERQERWGANLLGGGAGGALTLAVPGNCGLT